MSGKRERGGAGAEEARALDAFFRAAREEAMEPPSAAFLNAVFADAAEVSAGRAARARAPAPASAPVAAPAPSGPWRMLAGLLGGWRGGAALTACALLGFVLGVSGSDRYSTRQIETSAASGVTAAEAVGDFYDLASAE